MRTCVCPAAADAAPSKAKTKLDLAWRQMARDVRKAHATRKECLKAARRRARPLLGVRVGEASHPVPY